MTSPRASLACVLASIGLAGTAPAALAAPEAPVTEAASSITGSSATLRGELNPHAVATTGFQFDYNSNGTCREGQTTREAPEKTAIKLKVTAPVKGLEGSTEYTVCLLATHMEGELGESTPGQEVSFTTLAAKPVVEAQRGATITPTSATLEASVNPENQPTTECRFELGKTPKYGTTSPCEPPTIEGPTPVTVTTALAGLQPASTYHYRLVVKNATGETKGADTSFKTLPLEPPAVIGTKAADLTGSSAKLEALINPNYQQTTYLLEYAKDETLTNATVIEGSAPLEAGFAEDPVAVEANGLEPGTAYYFRVRATNATGTSSGPISSFQTLAAPAVTGEEALQPTRTTVQLAAGINPGGAETSFHFAYVSAAEYEPHAPNPYVNGETTPENATIGADHEAHLTGPVTISELVPGTVYHFAVVASNSVGATIGPDGTFTTAPATPPDALTGPATAIGATSATLTGSVNTHGLATTASFELGTAPNQGTLTLATIAASGPSELALTDQLGEALQPATTYYYRVIASNADGTSYGEELAFTTASLPTTLAIPPSAVGLPFATTMVLGAREAGPTGQHSSRQSHDSARQLLAKALKACRKKPRPHRRTCERQAKRRYQPKPARR